MINFNEQFISPVFGLRDSDTIAFCIADKKYSYRQLFDYVEQIYCKIENADDNLIGLYATDDVRTYASILALWLQGKAYVPLNPNQPNDRHAEVIDSVHTHTILSADAKYVSLVKDVVTFRRQAS